MTQPRRTSAKSGRPPAKRRAPATAKAGAQPADPPAPSGALWEILGRASSPLSVVARLHAYVPRHNAGAEWMTHSMLRALVARGHDVSVWLSRYSPDRDPYVVDGVQVMPFAARLDFGAAAKAADVIVSHLENVPAAAALARSFGRPFVALCHNTFQATFRNAGRGSTSLAVYNSQHMRVDAEAYFCEYSSALRPRASIVVRPPVLADDYATTPGDAITLINLNREKGGDVFWELAARMPHLTFLGVKGAYGQQIVKDLPNVEIVEHVPGDRMRDQVYARTRVLLMPSSYESWGRVAVEAMASAIPVLACPTSGLTESLADAGIFAERTDVAAWVAALQALTDPAQWAQASERAVARSKELDPAGDLAAWCEAIEALT